MGKIVYQKVLILETAPEKRRDKSPGFLLKNQKKEKKEGEKIKA